MDDLGSFYVVLCKGRLVVPKNFAAVNPLTFLAL